VMFPDERDADSSWSSFLNTYYESIRGVAICLVR
jgi:hypothetical protein